MSPNAVDAAGETSANTLGGQEANGSSTVEPNKDDSPTVSAHAAGTAPSAIEFLQKPAEAIAEAGSSLNEKIMAGFDFVGQKIEAVTGTKEGGEPKESTLANVGDKIVETIIEKPAAALSEAAAVVEEKINSSLFGASTPEAKDVKASSGQQPEADK
ncbi:hypothetical protein PLESTB_001523600 [Pleodorina starrii]|uniref:Uncharacterized protein n=1 Tax=Pleodorina starrii TaxID=330485 RepID=A0A9W6F7U8_9CHLO|nr:hypothetical protein PLESTM_001869600 [Pleodorina starrii]GLC59697.1 hypothetical protein PLESTB_001523600 [Pleodorina starrii]